MRAVTMAFLALVALAGCTGPQPVPEELVVRLANSGSSPKAIQLTVTAPDGERALVESLSVPGGSSVERSVRMLNDGTFTIVADFTQAHTSGGATQHVNGTQTHTVARSDCTTSRITVVFTFAYSTTRGQSWSNHGSRGHCE
jgi:hypothetical protein